MKKITIIFYLMAFSSCYANDKDELISSTSNEERRQLFVEQCLRARDCCVGCMSTLGSYWAANSANSAAQNDRSMFAAGSVVFAVISGVMINRINSRNEAIARLKGKKEKTE